MSGTWLKVGSVELDISFSAESSTLGMKSPVPSSSSEERMNTPVAMTATNKRENMINLNRDSISGSSLEEIEFFIQLKKIFLLNYYATLKSTAVRTN